MLSIILRESFVRIKNMYINIMNKIRVYKDHMIDRKNKRFHIIISNMVDGYRIPKL